MARILDIRLRRQSGEPVLGCIYLSYVEGRRRYVASGVVDSQAEHFWHDSAVEALRSAQNWVLRRGFQYVDEAPPSGQRVLRLVRFAGIASLTDEEISVPLEEEDLRALASCEHPRALHAFLTHSLRARLPSKQAQILEGWLGDPACSWGILPADAQKATSADIDFDIDESFLSFWRHRF